MINDIDDQLYTIITKLGFIYNGTKWVYKFIDHDEFVRNTLKKYDLNTTFFLLKTLCNEFYFEENGSIMNITYKLTNSDFSINATNGIGVTQAFILPKNGFRVYDMEQAIFDALYIFIQSYRAKIIHTSNISLRNTSNNNEV